MKKKSIPIFVVLIFSYLISFAQKTDSVTLEVNTVESRELLDYYRFEGIDYFNMQASGENIKDQYFILSSMTYWNGKLTKVDTFANTKIYRMKNGTDTLGIRVMSKKTDSDTIKFQFNLPRFSTTRKFPTTQKNTYSLRDITSNDANTFVANDPINLLVYSLPYEDPERPGYLFYCELSREGTPPEQWGEKFGIEHYIIFKLQLID
ncbi:MAG: hypothetical protein AAGI25_12560 [Bacteroidota bacterium]